MPLVDWSVCESRNDYEQAFLLKTIELNLKQNVHFNTTRAACLDLVFSSKDSIINAIALNDGLDGFSDHRPVGFEIVEESRKVKSGLKNYYSYCRGFLKAFLKA